MALIEPQAPPPEDPPPFLGSWNWLYAAVLGLLVLQIALGELQHRTGLPWGLVLVHVALSAVVWAVTAVLVLLLFRPPISLARTRT